MPHDIDALPIASRAARRARNAGGGRRGVRPPRTRVGLVLGLLAVLVPGCGTDGKADPAPAGDRAALTEIGIETRRWHIRAPLGPFLRSLGERSLEDSQLPASDRLAWRDAGLRLIDVPVADIDGLESAAPHTDAVRRAWLGQPTSWTPLVSRAASGIAADSPDDAGTTTHLLARSWVEPDVRRGPVFRVELAVARTDPASRDPGRPAVVGGLMFSGVLEPGRALLIVPADPGEDWTVPVVEAQPGHAEGERDPAGDLGPQPREEPDDENAGNTPEPGTPADRIGIAPLPAPPPAPRPDPRPTRPVGDGPVTDRGVGPGEVGPGEIGPVSPGGRSIGESLLLKPPVLIGDRPRPAHRTLVVIVPNWPSTENSRSP